jgi:hypothetical protein
VGVASRLILDSAPALEARLRGLAQRRVVFFAGLPGTGKSLLLHQLAHLAAAMGRRVHLLQWDVARPVFEASQAGRRYPLTDGVTDPVIRKAAGLWARGAVADWDQRHPGGEPLLIGETPLVGGRFVELTRRVEDRAEALLGSPACRFVVAVPSRDVRSFIEAERERRSAKPRHPRECEDAPPRVLREAWRELAVAAERLGIAATGDHDYDPVLYGRAYDTILGSRNVDVVSLDAILPAEAFSVYDFAAEASSLVPTPEETAAFIEAVERRYDRPSLEREIDGWWRPSP